MSLKHESFFLIGRGWLNRCEINGRGLCSVNVFLFFSPLFYILPKQTHHLRSFWVLNRPSWLSVTNSYQRPYNKSAVLCLTGPFSLRSVNQEQSSHPRSCWGGGGVCPTAAATGLGRAGNNFLQDGNPRLDQCWAMSWVVTFSQPDCNCFWRLHNSK